MTTEGTGVCSLGGTDLDDRLAQWGAVMSLAIDRRVEGGRVVSTYPRDEDLLAKIRMLIAAEAECCSFMDFTVEENAESFTVELRVPNEMSDGILEMLGRAHNATRVAT